MSAYNEYHRNYYLTHKEQFRKNNQNRRKALRHLCRCVICGKQDAFTMNGRPRCAECVEKDTVYQRERRGFKPAWMRDPKPKPDVNWPRGDNGYCYQCNKRPALAGKHTCQDCYDVKVRNLRECVWNR